MTRKWYKIDLLSGRMTLNIAPINTSTVDIVLDIKEVHGMDVGEVEREGRYRNLKVLSRENVANDVQETIIRELIEDQNRVVMAHNIIVIQEQLSC